jgi:hypothetical protein
MPQVKHNSRGYPLSTRTGVKLARRWIVQKEKQRRLVDSLKGARTRSGRPTVVARGRARTKTETASRDAAMSGSGIIEDLVQEAKIVPDSKMTLGRKSNWFSPKKGRARTPGGLQWSLVNARGLMRKLHPACALL